MRGLSGDQPMRVLAILALALLLASCEGDRIKHGSMNERQAQPQSTVLT
jgi:PBP1b-binding outer membrane lipoprotein LpoB